MHARPLIAQMARRTPWWPWPACLPVVSCLSAQPCPGGSTCSRSNPSLFESWDPRSSCLLAVCLPVCPPVLAPLLSPLHPLLKPPSPSCTRFLLSWLSTPSTVPRYQSNSKVSVISSPCCSPALPVFSYPRIAIATTVFDNNNINKNNSSILDDNDDCSKSSGLQHQVNQHLLRRLTAYNFFRLTDRLTAQVGKQLAFIICLRRSTNLSSIASSPRPKDNKKSTAERDPAARPTYIGRPFRKCFHCNQLWLLYNIAPISTHI